MEIAEFNTSGVTIFRVFSEAELKVRNAAFLDMVRSYPEFSSSSDHPVMGGFGAHATPSSYHHPTVQTMRMELYMRFYSHFMPAVAKMEGYSYWHMLFDRVCTRGPLSGAMTAESWHFDHCDDTVNSNLAEKQLTGGWVNLNVDKDQYFYGLKGKFGTAYMEGGKYRPLPKALHPEFEACWLAQGGPIRVPPGYLICFKPELVHKVNPGKTPELGIRLYLGSVMTKVERPLYNFGRREIEANLLGFTGSGQRPPTWAAMSWVFRPEEIQTWTLARKPHPNYLETVTVSAKGKGKHAGKTFTRVVRFMLEPIVIYGYTEQNVAIMLPMRV